MNTKQPVGRSHAALSAKNSNIRLEVLTTITQEPTKTRVIMTSGAETPSLFWRGIQGVREKG